MDAGSTTKCEGGLSFFYKLPTIDVHSSSLMEQTWNRLENNQGTPKCKVQSLRRRDKHNKHNCICIFNRSVLYRLSTLKNEYSQIREQPFHINVNFMAVNVTITVQKIFYNTVGLPYF